MDNCVAVVMAAVAAYRCRKQRTKNIDQLPLVLGWSTRKTQSCPENISKCSLCNVSFSGYVLGTV